MHSHGAQKAGDCGYGGFIIKLTFTKSDTQNQIDTRWDVQAVAQSLDGETVFDIQNGIFFSPME